MRVKSTIVPALVAVSGILLILAESVRAQGPKPGEGAPAVVVSRWLWGDPVGKYEPGQVYVVDLWATWCKPCIASLPLLHELEGKFAGRATFVAVNVWETDPQRILKFLGTHDGALPSHVALDSIPAGKEFNEGFTVVGFTGTSERIAIPASYIVDQQGRLAWIGRPHGIEGPLAEILAGTWDLPAFTERYAQELAAADSTAAGP